MMPRPCIFLTLVFLCSSCGEAPEEHSTSAHSPAEFETEIDHFLNGMSSAVVCDHPVGAAVGAEILNAGGNAVDAVVAVQWALAVCYPQAGNLGGGGFLMYRSAEGEVSALDFREKAPSAAYEKLFQDREGNVVEGISLNTRLGAGVPGSVEGIFSMHREFGSMDMPALMQPAITLAREGFELTAVQAELLNRYRDDFVARNRAEVAFVKKAGKWEAGDTLVQPELASTLERIRTYGEDEFYAGTTAQLIEEEMLFGRGLISGQDLAEYTAVWRTPVETEFYGYRLYGVPPPSSGGVTIGQMLALAEMLRVDTLDLSHTNRLADYVHRMIEIQRRTFADRAAYLGDPEFRPAPVVDLLDSAYLASRIADLDLHRASPPLAPNPYSIRESRETTHISIVDAEGNAASVTTTLNGLYGSKIAVTGAGFLLNNQMDDFSAKPGSPNQFGLIGGTANAIAPHKRMLSSMSPSIVIRDNDLYLVTGARGGPTILTSVFQQLMNTAVFGMDLEESFAVPRFHLRGPSRMEAETELYQSDLVRDLGNMGHENISEAAHLGGVNSILVNADGTLQAAGDPRGGYWASGQRSKSPKAEQPEKESEEKP